MFKTISSLLAKRPTLHAELELDHVELSHEHLVVGLRVTWRNETPEAMEIREVMIHLYHQGKKETPLLLSYNGRFVRIPFQKTITKIAGANSFHLKSRASRVESLRFMTREIIDLKDGSYAAELHSTVADGTYLHEFDLKVVPSLKQRAAGSENETTPLGTTQLSAYTRALRLGLKPDAAK